MSLYEVLPKFGVYHFEITSDFVLCKPKVMPLKSVTLEKLDTMQKEAQDQLKAEEKAESESMLPGISSSTFSRSHVNLDLST